METHGDNFTEVTTVTVSVANFEVNLTSCSGKFHVVFEHFKGLKNLILNILKKKFAISFLAVSYTLKSV